VLDQILRAFKLLTLHDVAKDTGIFALFTSPWAFFANLNWTLVFGFLNLLVLTFFRWRALKLRERELELRHDEDFRAIRARLSKYESVEDVREPEPRAPSAAGRAVAVLSRALRARGVAGPR
jgi:hypothetical protein